MLLILGVYKGDKSSISNILIFDLENLFISNQNFFIGPYVVDSWGLYGVNPVDDWNLLIDIMGKGA